MYEIKKQISKETFDELTGKISQHGYSAEQLIINKIVEKELNEQKIEYDDYISIFKIYNVISSQNNN